MKDQFVTYEIAKAMKELGFNAFVCGSYDSNKELNSVAWTYKNNMIKNQITIAAPLWQQAVEWARDRYNLIIVVSPKYLDDGENYRYTFLLTKFESNTLWEGNGFKYYNEAMEAAILKTLDLLKAV